MTAGLALDLRWVRYVGLAMLGAAALRPEIPMEVVPPCPLRSVTGIPCPLCGMTRGVTAAVHGDVANALLMSPASIVAVATTILLVVQWRARRAVLPVWALVAVVSLMWSWQLFKYATGRPL